MQKQLVISLAFLFTALYSLQGQPTVVPLWKGEVPNNKATDIPEGSRESNGEITHVYDVTDPSLTIYRAKVEDNVKVPAVIICPGGGYTNLSILKEGHRVAEYLAENGITGIVLKYRLPRDEMQIDKTLAPIQDAQQAILTVRSRAAAWNIIPDKIGIMGFSAGGHLAATASTRRNFWLVEGENLRPDFSILIYPVISMNPGITHMGSHNNLLGEDAARALEIEYSNELQINKNTPPAFLVHSFDDRAVPVANSLRYAQRLQEFDIECEMHLYKKGGHGYGMNPGYTDTWPKLMINWINDLD
ncbi:alpha/beta hydrolase [Roseimarinus sediminis]|uniref:alpha/beta hydrolase n=1 Tax=Roseimarinus sediminis TaxID=1610899 RepID=UPI003D2076E7